MRNKGGHSSRPRQGQRDLPAGRCARPAGGVRVPGRAQRGDARLLRASSAGRDRSGLAADMRAVAAAKPRRRRGRAAVGRAAVYNAQLRTTCVATRLEGGHANNALPQLARATVNCRDAARATPRRRCRRTLARVARRHGDSRRASAQRARAGPPSPLRPEVMRADRAADGEDVAGRPGRSR